MIYSIKKDIIMGNEKLAKAKDVKNDECYTRWRDIEQEVLAYLDYDKDTFRGKTVLCPCDDPEWSNFTKFFALRFTELGLKKLICTSYAPDTKVTVYNRQLSLFEMDDTPFVDSPNFDKKKQTSNGKIFILEEKNTDSIKRMSIENIKWDYLKGDGDFRSSEITKLRDESDIIVTNPPFSLFNEFWEWLTESHKKFIIIANKLSLAYKNIFPYVMKNQVWSGVTRWSGGLWFTTTPNADETDRNTMKNVAAIFITNLDHGRRHKPLELLTMEENLRYSRHKDLKQKGYLRLENYDAIDVPYTNSIPKGYKGIMALPPTFLEYFCPEQFEIVGMCENLDLYGLKTRLYTSVEKKDAYFAKFGRKGDYDLNASGVYIENGLLEKTATRILIREKEST